MLRYIYDQDEKVARFVAKLIPHVDRGFPTPYKSIGVADNHGGLIAGAVYYNWNKKNGTIEVALAALPNAKWLNRDTMKHMAEYAFKQRGCQMIILRVRAENKRLLDMLSRLGCKLITIPRLYGRNNDGVMCLLTDDTYNKHPAVRRNDVLMAFGGAVHSNSYLQGFSDGGDTETTDNNIGGDEGAPPSDDVRSLGYRLLGNAMADNPRGQAAIDQPTSTGPDRPAGFEQRFTGATGIPLPRPRPADAPQAPEEVSSQAGLPLPAAQANPYAAARQGAMGGPDRASWGEIMNSRSPMYRDEVPQRKTLREIITDPRGRSDFLTRFGANVLAANPAHGWGSTIGQGLSGAIGTFDKFATEDMSTRQKAQSLAAAIKKHTESLGETSRYHQATEDIARERLAQDNWKTIGVTTEGAPVMMNTKTREVINGATQQPLTASEKMNLTGRGGAGGGVTERIIASLRAEDPSLTYAEALGIARRSGQSPDVLTLRKEALALSAAKAETAYFKDPDGTIEKHRRRYGLPPQAGTLPPTGGLAAGKPDVIQKGRLFKFNQATNAYEDAGPAP